MSKQDEAVRILNDSLQESDVRDKQDMAGKIAADFVEFLNTFHSYREPFDTELDIWLHEQYARVMKERKFFDFKSQPYFSPSSANSCPRELYVKIKREKRDNQDVKPWQRRWTALGTAIGDTIQREILLAERHYEKFTGEKPYFKMKRTKSGGPAFEDFIKTMKVIEHNGKKFSLFGTSDGIMDYISEDGEKIRVGLEIKSKQTTHAQTGDYKMRAPKEDHVKQCTAYSLMYDVDFFIILYVNASKKSWNMTPEDFCKYPDIRAFGIYITDDMKNELLDYFASIVDAVENEEPPKMDVDKFTFNNFKTATVNSLTDEEVEEIRTIVGNMTSSKSKVPDWKKKSLKDMLDFIDEVRQAD